MGFSRAEVVEDLYGSFEGRDPERAVRHLADDCRWEVPAFGMTLSGGEEIRRDIENWVKAFPDLRIELRAVAESADCVFVELLARGTQSGPLSMPTGTIPPTHRPVELPLCDVLRFQGEQVVSIRSYLDAMAFMKQLGAGVSPPAELARQPVQVSEPVTTH